MTIGERMYLIREPKNKVDEDAIMIKNAKKHKVGYVPRSHNEVIARLMDAGKSVYAVAKNIYDTDENYHLIFVEIYMED